MIRLWAIAQQETCRLLNNNNNKKMTLREKRRSMGARLGFHAHAHSFFKRPQHARLPRLAWLILFFSLIYLFVMSSFNIRFLLNFFFISSFDIWFIFISSFDIFIFIELSFNIICFGLLHMRLSHSQKNFSTFDWCSILWVFIFVIV